MALKGGHRPYGLNEGLLARGVGRLEGAVAVCLLVAAGPAFAECTGLPMNQTQPAVNSFLVRPEGLLERYPRGEVGLTPIIAQLVASSYRSTLKPIIKLIDRGNGQQRLAIGRGLAIAVSLCRGKDASMIEAVANAIEPHHELEFLTGYYELETERTSPATSAGAAPRTGGVTLGDPFKIAPLRDPFAPLR